MTVPVAMECPAFGVGLAFSPLAARSAVRPTPPMRSPSAIQYLRAWTKKTNVVTREWAYVNTSGEPIKMTVTEEHITTVKGAFDATAGATGTIGSNFFGELGIEIGPAMHGEGTHTTSTNVKTEITIPGADGKYIYHRGTRRGSGRYERWSCGSHSCSRMGYKSGHSWNSNSIGSISRKKPSQDGLSATVKKRYS
ncbi:hypothetical protein [Streptomyces sp. NPDC002763]|uniref:hypothetical protein n=1 Tax=Streptomyces sp. NPDC002763 TaxID=3154427 RepID=UPI00332A556D